MGKELATYYDILRISHRAAPERVRGSYRKLAQRYHPDKMPGNADAERVMAMLNEAYAVLSDPERRARYDVWVASTDGKAAARRRRQAARRMGELAMGPAWPWYLLCATILFALGSVATVLYTSAVPPVAAPAAVKR